MSASRFPKLCFYNHKVTLFFFFFPIVSCLIFYQNPNNDWLITLHSDPSIFIKREKNKLFARILVHKLRLHCLKNYVINPNQDFWILMTTLLPNNIYINTYNMWYVISSTIISKDKRWTQKKKGYQDKFLNLLKQWWPYIYTSQETSNSQYLLIMSH